MRADRGARGAAGALALGVAVLLAAGPVAAQQIHGRAEVQYRRTETGRGTPARALTEAWIQTYELNHTLPLRAQTYVVSQLRLTDLSYARRPEASRAPYGSLRLQNPAYGLFASYRPTTTTGFFGDSAARTEVTSRDREAALSGHLAIPGAPRLLGSWVRRQRDRDLTGPEQAATNRSLRASHELGPLSLRGGYGDIESESARGGGTRVLQRTWDGSASLRLAPAAGFSMAMDYGFAQTERPVGAGPTQRTRSHDASLSAGLSRSPRAAWNLSYAFRNTELPGGRDGRPDSHDGSLHFNYRPGRGLQMTAGAGARTSSQVEDRGLLRFANATLSASGRVREGWDGSASFSHTTHWLPGRAPYSAQGLSAMSRLALRRGLDVNGGFQVSASGDSALRSGRVALQTTLNATVSPWRSLTVTVGEHRYRSGPGLGRSEAGSRSGTMSVRWQPLRTLELTASRGATRAVPDGGSRSGTSQWAIRYNPGSRLQLWGGYTRSDRSRPQGGSDQLAGREVASARIIARIWAATTLNAGLGVAEPGRAGETRQYDVAVTRSFGR